MTLIEVIGILGLIVTISIAVINHCAANKRDCKSSLVPVKNAILQMSKEIKTRKNVQPIYDKYLPLNPEDIPSYYGELREYDIEERDPKDYFQDSFLEQYKIIESKSYLLPNDLLFKIETNVDKLNLYSREEDSVDILLKFSDELLNDLVKLDKEISKYL